MKRSLILVLALLILSQFGCARERQMQVRVNWNKDFTQLKSWHWWDEQPVVADALLGGDLLDSFIRKAVTKELEAKGMRLVSERPDFVVRYAGKVQEAVEEQPAGSNMASLWSWREGPTGSMQRQSERRAALVVEILEPDEKAAPIWRGEVEDAVADRNEAKTKVPAIVKQILSGFPPTRARY